MATIFAGCLSLLGAFRLFEVGEQLTGRGVEEKFSNRNISTHFSKKVCLNLDEMERRRPQVEKVSVQIKGGGPEMRRERFSQQLFQPTVAGRLNR